MFQTQLIQRCQGLKLALWCTNTRLYVAEESAKRRECWNRVRQTEGDGEDHQSGASEVFCHPANMTEGQNVWAECVPCWCQNL